MLLELEDNDRLEVRIVVMFELAWFRALSIEDELFENWFEVVFTAPSAASTLVDELERLRLDV